MTMAKRSGGKMKSAATKKLDRKGQGRLKVVQEGSQSPEYVTQVVRRVLHVVYRRHKLLLGLDDEKWESLSTNARLIRKHIQQFVRALEGRLVVLDDLIYGDDRVSSALDRHSDSVTDLLDPKMEECRQLVLTYRRFSHPEYMQERAEIGDSLTLLEATALALSSIGGKPIPQSELRILRHLEGMLKRSEMMYGRMSEVGRWQVGVAWFLREQFPKEEIDPNRLNRLTPQMRSLGQQYLKKMLGNTLKMRNMIREVFRPARRSKDRSEEIHHTVGDPEQDE